VPAVAGGSAVAGPEITGADGGDGGGGATPPPGPPPEPPPPPQPAINTARAPHATTHPLRIEFMCITRPPGFVAPKLPTPRKSRYHLNG
jgi:hypothetical protein